MTNAAEAIGGKLESFYYAFGDANLIGVIEFPDNVTAAAFSAAGNSGGFVRLSLTPLMTAEEMDRALEKFAGLPEIPVLRR